MAGTDEEPTEDQDTGPRRDPAPFIVGVARSGTTLLRLMLDAHPDLAIPPETHFLPRLIRLTEELEERRESQRRRRREIRDFLTGHPRWEDFGLSSRELTRALKREGKFTPRRVARLFYALYAEQHGKTRWGDKTPAYINKMVQIRETLPEARFIHLIRDGRDVALSLSEVQWGTADVREAAIRWKEEVRVSRRRARSNLNRRAYMELRYEDLVAEPEPSLRRVAEHIRLPWDDAMLNYHLTADERMREVARDLRGEGGATISAEARSRQHALVNEPPRTSRVGRWRTEMSDGDRRAFEAVAGRMLERMGYEVEDAGTTEHDVPDDEEGEGEGLEGEGAGQDAEGDGAAGSTGTGEDDGRG